MAFLDLPDLENARDVGGVPLADGTVVADGVLLRTDNHDKLTPAGIDAVRRLAVRRILDVRHAWEARKFPSPFASDPIYRNVPLDRDRPDFDPTAPDDYRILTDTPDTVAAAFTALAEAPEGPVMVHCHGGRDRTGILVALALAVAGASTEAITAEYALTEGTDPETMTRFFAHLKERHGGVERFLSEAGVGTQHLEAVKKRLIDGSGIPPPPGGSAAGKLRSSRR